MQSTNIPQLFAQCFFPRCQD